MPKRGTGLVVDASDRARAHEVQARLAAIVDSSDDAIISKSLDGRILTWNGGAERREADRVKDEFLAIVAHELRNRLAPICNAVETLLVQGRVPPESKPALDVIDRQTQQMVRLVEDLLDVSRIAHNELPLRKKRVKLQDVLLEALEVSRPLIDEREHGLSVSVAPRTIHLHGDRVRLGQAITNLLNNAAKYTDPRGRIWLTAERDGNEAVITVRDDGAGIAPEMLPHVFEMFVQVDSSLEPLQHGLGVGLTLVKRIVDLHGGTVEARSDGPGKGSEFEVRLPVAKRRPRKRLAQPNQTTGNGAQRILVVDDDPDLAKSLAMTLTAMGNDVRTAHDGDEALQIAAAFRPHVVAIDLNLSAMSGLDVVQQLRREAWGAQIITIALTGWTQDEVRQRALDAGFDHYVVKPVEAALLTKLLGAM